MSKRLINILIPIFAVLLGIIVGTIIMLVSGYNPVDAFIALWTRGFW